MEAIVLPILEKGVLDELDPDEVAAEQARQRTKMQVRRKDAINTTIIIIAFATRQCAA